MWFSSRVVNVFQIFQYVKLKQETIFRMLPEVGEMSEKDSEDY